MSTNRDAIYRAAWDLTNVEAALIRMKDQLCDGSMLSGHTAKKEVNQTAVQHHLALLKLSVDVLTKSVGEIK